MQRYKISPGVADQSRVRSVERAPGDPTTRPLRVFAVDPSIEKSNGAIATLNVPFETLEPGPIGRFFEVECRDGDVALTPLDLDDPRVLIQSGVPPSAGNPAFHQQMVYAVASNVYATFRQALGRLVAWGYDESSVYPSPRLKLRPHVASEGCNASYDKCSREVRFGYTEDHRLPGSGRVFCCLSHDAIAHELTHALIDGIRSRFTIPTNPDVLGLHEGLADLIALLHRFLHKDVLLSQIRRVGPRFQHSALLTEIAAELSTATGGKDAIRTAVDPRGEVLRYSPDQEPHVMGNVLLNAVFDAFVTIYQRKTERYVRLAGPRAEGFLPEELIQILTDQASTLARQFLNICIRAIDYCPPVDIELGEYLRALLTADFNLVPDDPWGYRQTLIRAFAKRGIYPRGVLALSEDALLWRAPNRHLPPLQGLSFSSLRFNGDPSVPASADELTRQANVLGEFLSNSPEMSEFGLAPPGGDTDPAVIQSIRTSRRVGPDGQVLFDLIAEVTQRRMATHPASGLTAKFVGGSTLVIGPKGEIRYSISKNIRNQARLLRQFDYQDASPHWKQLADGQYHLTGWSLRLMHQRRNQ